MRDQTAIFVVDMCCVSIYRVGSFLGTNKMVQIRAEFVCNNIRGNPGMDWSGRLRSVTLVSLFSVEPTALKATCNDSACLNSEALSAFTSSFATTYSSSSVIIKIIIYVE